MDRHGLLLETEVQYVDIECNIPLNQINNISNGKYRYCSYASALDKLGVEIAWTLLMIFTGTISLIAAVYLCICLSMCIGNICEAKSRRRVEPVAVWV